MSVTIRFLDKEVTAAIEKVADEIQGKRKWPVADKIIQYKTKRLSEPWRKKGIDEAGRGKQWAPQAKSTVRRKFPGLQTMWWSDKQHQLVPMKEALADKARWMHGGGMMQNPQIPQALYYKKLMEDTGALRWSLAVKFSKGRKTGRMEFLIWPKSGPARRYAGVHIGGAAIRQTRTKRTWSGTGRRGNQRTLTITEKEYSWQIPARPWAVWTDRDIDVFVKEFEDWFANRI